MRQTKENRPVFFPRKEKILHGRFKTPIGNRPVSCFFTDDLRYNAHIMEQHEQKREQNITELLLTWNDGNQQALEKLMPLVYDELHRQAARFLRRERSDHTLQTTALIHEAYLKLVNQPEINWESRTHFFAIAANIMRRILVDYARSKNAEKRGGDFLKMPLEEAGEVAGKEKSVDLMALDEALTKLEAIDRRQARIVELKFFGDLTLEETAKALKISRTTVADDWAMARAWLHRELTR
jgi:RNA polymerase sigma factor (TIGR02999 family)